MNPQKFMRIVLDLQQGKALIKRQEKEISRFSLALGDISELKNDYLNKANRDRLNGSCKTYSPKLVDILNHHYGFGCKLKSAVYMELDKPYRHEYVIVNIAGYDFIVDITADQFEPRNKNKFGGI